jgi:hypothetical protein
MEINKNNKKCKNIKIKIKNHIFQHGGLAQKQQRKATSNLTITLFTTSNCKFVFIFFRNQIPFIFNCLKISLCSDLPG